MSKDKKEEKIQRNVLGLDLGTNSIGWALLTEKDGVPSGIIDMGCRIFPKGVEDKTPTPKNAARRNARLTRRVIQRRSRRKKRMQNYLIKLGLLPIDLKDHTQPEIILNQLGNPYQLRAKALDEELSEHELGRVFLHLVQRRGFLSNRKTLFGDMLDDPDVLAILEEEEQNNDDKSERAKEETAFKKDISKLRSDIKAANCRSLGEYLAQRKEGDCKRNRSHAGGLLRTDRQMYKDELNLIWDKQKGFHPKLNDKIKEQIETIIFFQRPLKLKADRIGKCSLEPSRQRANIARIDVQRFRYLQDINNLRYSDYPDSVEASLNDEEREKLADLFEKQETIAFSTIKKTLNLKKVRFNLEEGTKVKLRGNTTACKIRKVFPDWDQLNDEKKNALVEDLLTIKKKSVLKKRLIDYWKFKPQIAVKLALIEFEQGHANLSVKAISNLLPFLEEGLIYSDARQKAGYDYEIKEGVKRDTLGPPPESSNPIVRRALHELRRLVNAIIAHHGKIDVIRIEMARDLEMNTKKYKEYEKQQKSNQKLNDEAEKHYCDIAKQNQGLNLNNSPSRADKIKYRLWKDQNERCAYSGQTINMTQLYSPDIEVDHILPYSTTFDNSYMNKVVCFAAENRKKSNRTPKDAFSHDQARWEQITQALKKWGGKDGYKLRSKTRRFSMSQSDLADKDFASSQLNDTRYISKLALAYLKTIDIDDVSTSKGRTTAWCRHQWGLNRLIGTRDQKERNDHRHHAIDALIIACVNRYFYRQLAGLAKQVERKQLGDAINRIELPLPWKTLAQDAKDILDQMIISHCPQRKIAGALHEETGVGFIEGVGTVYRKTLGPKFEVNNAKAIIDEEVKTIVLSFLKEHNDNPKEAFKEGFVLYHKDGKTPIKRVRVRQSKTPLKKLEQDKLAIKDRAANVFRWMAYGNTHHVEIIRNKKTAKVEGRFVTTYEAAQRARGIKGKKQPIVKRDHGADYEFVMALHGNEMVSLERNGEKNIYRIKKIEYVNRRVTAIIHTVSHDKNKDKKVIEDTFSINNALFDKKKITKLNVNILGKIID